MDDFKFIKDGRFVDNFKSMHGQSDKADSPIKIDEVMKNDKVIKSLTWTKL